VFDEMFNMDVISAYTKSGNIESAEELFDGLFDF
jgi:pentatricopeptide repeat protein